MSDSPINQLSPWSLSIPCLQALCKTAIYSICVICQLMDRHSLRNFKTSRGMKTQLRDGFQPRYLPFSKTDLSFSRFNITDSRCVIRCIFGMRVSTDKNIWAVLLRKVTSVDAASGLLAFTFVVWGQVLTTVRAHMVHFKLKRGAVIARSRGQIGPCSLSEEAETFKSRLFVLPRCRTSNTVCLCFE